MSLQSIGLATAEFEVPLFTDEPKFPSFFYPKPDSGRYLKGEPYGLSLARDRLSARVKALAEFYERLCLHNARVDDQPTRWEPQTGWTDPAGLAEQSAKLDPDQLRVLRGSAYRWVRAVEIQTGRVTAVPAQTVIPNYRADGEARILQAVGSSGAALGRRGTRGAFERGLFEVIERYATASYDFRERLRLRIVNMPPRIRDVQETLRRYRLEPFVFRLPNRFSTPCVFVVLTDHSGIAPALSFSSRAAPTFEEAVETALLEALERRRPARIEQSTLKQGDRRVYPWAPLENLLEVEPHLKEAKTEEFSSLPSTQHTVRRLEKVVTGEVGEILLVDLTLPEVAEAGFEAVKVVIPGLGPMPA